MNKLEVLLLDLRGNSGGSLEAAVQVVERFIPAPQAIGSTSGKDNRIYQSLSMNVVDVPMFVLVDGNTASAAELVAGALKSRKGTELVGQNTFGKNLVQKLLPVSVAPYGAVRLTWSKFHLPKPDDWRKQGGIAPTIPTPAGDEETVALQRARSLTMMR
jgi:carboxyl-terminal processing protease